MFRILAFTVKPCESADTRYRILQYRGIAETTGIRIDHRSLMNQRYFNWQLRNQQLYLRLLLYPFLWIVRLFQVLFLARSYDAVWVSREMAPLGPPIFEKLLFRICKRVILDVDDALHIADKETSRLIPRLLRDRGKFSAMAASYTTVVCGNRYLADYYHQYSSDVRIVPTVIDTSRYESVRPTVSDVVRVGWIGTPLNRHHLDILRPALTRLAQDRRFELVIVGLNDPLDWNLPSLRYIPWKLADELFYFSQFDIGIMPLQDSPFARGKCAFKLLQYMAARLPVVASPVGANCEVVENGKNGFLADSTEEWQATLQLLIDNPELRLKLGSNGHDLVHKSYSVEAVWLTYATILTGVTKKEPICVV